MKSYLVVLDGTPISWEAAYVAFHLAARLGSKLIGLAARRPGGERIASQWLAEFETGARAAGITVESRLVVDLDADTVGGQADATDGVFIGQRGNASGGLLAALLDNLPCDLWLVPRQTSVRRILGIYPEPPSRAGAPHFAELLSRRLEVELVAQPKSSYDLLDGQVPLGQIRARVQELGADLLILDRTDRAMPWTDLCLEPPCLTILLAS